MREYEIRKGCGMFVWYSDGDYLIEHYNSTDNTRYVISYIGNSMFGIKIIKYRK